MSDSFDALDANIKKFLDAIYDCTANDRSTPALVLLYSLIDTMAWLDCPATQNDVGKKDFVAWTEAFMLKNSELRCTGIDLYAARCALVHNHAADSMLSRKGEARHIYYAFGNRTTTDIDLLNEALWKRQAVAVHFYDLTAAFLLGLNRFRKAVEADAPRAAKVEARIGKMLAAYKGPTPGQPNG